MKNKIAESLNQELRGVRVSPELRRRILASARRERLMRRRKRFSALSAIAAMLVVTLAVVGGLKVVRKPVPDRRYASGDTAAVWLDEIDRLYHSKRSCTEHSMTVTSAADARARGFSACRKCIPVIGTPQPEITAAPTESIPESTEAISEQSIGSTPVPIDDAIFEAVTIVTAEPTDDVIIEPEATAEPTDEAILEPEAAAEPINELETVAPTVSVTIEPESTPIPEDEFIAGAAAGEQSAGSDLVYLTEIDGDKRFHTDPNDVSGVRISVSRLTALEQGYLPCENCGANDAIYWMTDGGAWFHSAQNCQSMTNASPVTALDAISAGKSPCPICFDQSVVWMTDGGIWYHSAAHCQNMVGAKQVAQSIAESLGKARCPFCFVSPSDPSWAEQISTGILADIQAYTADGVLMLSAQLDPYISPLYGDPLVNANLDPNQLAKELRKLIGSDFPEYSILDAAQSISAGNQIGIRLLRYQIDAIYLYDSDGEIPHGDVRSYISDDFEYGMLYVTDLDASRTPESVWVDLSVFGASYYLDESGIWQTEETQYAFNVSFSDGDPTFTLFIADPQDNTSLSLEVGVNTLAHYSSSLADGCTIDAYGDPDDGEFNLAFITDATADQILLNNESIIDDVMSEYTGYAAMFLRQTNDPADSRIALLLDPTLTQRTLTQAVYALRKNLGGSSISGATVPAASANRAEVKSGISNSSTESDAGVYVP